MRDDPRQPDVPPVDAAPAQAGPSQVEPGSEAPDYKGFSIHYPSFLRPVRLALVAGLARGLFRLAGRMSVPALQRTGRALGTVAHALSAKQRRLCALQLELALPELGAEAHARIAREVLQQQGMTLLEILAMPRLRAEGERWVRMEGEDALREAHALGKGVLLITAHTGNWETIGIALARLGIKGVAMVSTNVNPTLNRMLAGVRRTEFLDLAERGSGESPRALLTALKAGHPFILACDVDIETQGVFVDFFGVPANTPRAPASLALKLGTPLVTYFDIRNPDGTHTIRFAEVPVTDAHCADPDPARAVTQALNDAIEAHIRAYPGQWAWNHRRWKRRPPAVQDV